MSAGVQFGREGAKRSQRQGGVSPVPVRMGHGLRDLERRPAAEQHVRDGLAADDPVPVEHREDGKRVNRKSEQPEMADRQACEYQSTLGP